MLNLNTLHNLNSAIWNYSRNHHSLLGAVAYPRRVHVVYICAKVAYVPIISVCATSSYLCLTFHEPSNELKIKHQLDGMRLKTSKSLYLLLQKLSDEGYEV